ncbi:MULTISPECIES: hypothetical protein [unclassified Acinetobacter]|uniref:hypothetical protein n=1 Tax=unclassified Acinetobacter TaxID=196816 RepID=UPI0029341C1E|nr:MULTISPECIES: hypothetical protein [unclassified Acinetobacter]WOE31978.1 hypothetical protein QSG84_01760 [Acinetobacter sp. SAAs470]WOE37446.1 hypothetical protein QSG86_10805 [Acinetobacter sp. SAAs474]
MSNYRVDTDVDFNEVNNRVRDEIKRTVNALTLKLQRTIQEDMLTGQRLNVQSGRLRGSVSSKVEEDKDWIEGTVGAGGALVPYAPAHEFGLKGSISIKAHVRNIKQAFGRPITPRQSMIGAHTRRINLRERRFMRDSLDEIAKIVPKNINAAIQRGLSE